MYSVGLEETLEDIGEVVGRDADAGIGDADAEGIALEGGGYSDGAIVGSELDSVADEVEEYALHLLGVNGEGGARQWVGLVGEFDIATADDGIKRGNPLANGGIDVNLNEVEREFVVLVFAEIKDLIDETPQDFDIFVGETSKDSLLGIEVGSGGELSHGLCDECKRCAQVV